MTILNKGLSRRDFIGKTSLLAAGVLAFPHKLFAQSSPVYIIIDEAKKSPVTIKRLRPNVSVLQGSGGNIGVLDTNDGKVMIDAGIDVSNTKIREALTKISDNPLKYLINTHWHFDHTSGNEWLHRAGAGIIAHKNTLRNLSREIRVKEWNYTFQPVPQAALPGETFETEHHLQLGNSTIRLHHLGNAHTDSDISVYLEKENVLFTGDVWWNGYYPFIDADTNGHIKGMISAVDTCIKKANDDTIIVPGHGPVGDKKQLERFRIMTQTITSKIATSKKQGKTLDEVIALKPTKEFDAMYGNFVINGDWFTRLVYQTL